MMFVRRAFLHEKDGKDNLRKLEERFFNDALTKSDLPLLRCPYCSYAEIDDLALPDTNLFANIHIKPHPHIPASSASLERLGLYLLRVTFYLLLIGLSSILLLISPLPKPAFLLQPVTTALRKIHLKRRGLRFQCRSPTCARRSCLACSTAWHDPHTCYSSQLTSLRQTVDRAATDAIKRTCPNCNVGFVKLEGCNKLVCVCGYQMCYVCREGLGDQGYTHFCQHFRLRPGQACAECERCDLYRVEGDEKVIAKARELAEKEWWARQGEDGKKSLEVEVGRNGIPGAKPTRVSRWDGFGPWLEKLVEAVFM